LLKSNLKAVKLMFSLLLGGLMLNVQMFDDLIFIHPARMPPLSNASSYPGFQVQIHTHYSITSIGRSIVKSRKKIATFPSKSTSVYHEKMLAPTVAVLCFLFCYSSPNA
jgi:hypothetical protein